MVLETRLETITGENSLDIVYCPQIHFQAVHIVFTSAGCFSPVEALLFG